MYVLAKRPSFFGVNALDLSSHPRRYQSALSLAQRCKGQQESQFVTQRLLSTPTSAERILHFLTVVPTKNSPAQVNSTALEGTTAKCACLGVCVGERLVESAASKAEGGLEDLLEAIMWLCCLMLVPISPVISRAGVLGSAEWPWLPTCHHQAAASSA